MLMKAIKIPNKVWTCIPWDSLSSVRSLSYTLTEANMRGVRQSLVYLEYPLRHAMNPAYQSAECLSASQTREPSDEDTIYALSFWLVCEPIFPEYFGVCQLKPVYLERCFHVGKRERCSNRSLRIMRMDPRALGDGPLLQSNRTAAISIDELHSWCNTWVDCCEPGKDKMSHIRRAGGSFGIVLYEGGMSNI